ncbi:hypothetical protein CGLO_15860 [Colletotrichum gloeosporioides Cg-14]|uniref:Uncharacterized protein n=1 Tax=Colletotrichum gloeosporioides (strain Cg-14) TaxID=1237896 RepID=T0JXT6_COLGC|nr:hypothetical protein CGLO_15860 [Colletotrichum gloeosporioides Cg-14]
MKFNYSDLDIFFASTLL